MWRRIVILYLVTAYFALACAAETPQRFVQKLAVSSQLTAVVAEGDLEARSIGSYTVRVYSKEGEPTGDDTTFYKTGIVRRRDGTVESISLADLLANAPPMLVVTIRSAGSGGYLSAEAFVITGKTIRLAGSVSGLPPSADIFGALRKEVAHGSKGKRMNGS
jgi:hypothetical protein